MENKSILVKDVTVTVNTPTKVLHFSDGVDEEIEEDATHDLSSASAPPEQDDTDPKSLTWVPWFSYYAWKSGTKMLNAVDYAGEGLASFFGITTPKYQIEISEYERMQEEKRKMDEESAGWVNHNAGGDIPLVMDEPRRMAVRPENV